MKPELQPHKIEMTVVVPTEEQIEVIKSSFVDEAKALLAIAETLAGFSDEKACAVMAQVSSALGLYDEAERFIQLARAHRDYAGGGSR